MIELSASEKELYTEVMRGLQPVGNEIPCRCCGGLWTPCVWNFYGLCTLCFDPYDSQRKDHQNFGGSNPLFYQCFGEKIQSADEWCKRLPAKAAELGIPIAQLNERLIAESAFFWQAWYKAKDEQKSRESTK